MHAELMEFVQCIALVLAGYQFVVSARLLRFAGYDRRQKLAQLAMIWFLPCFGALVVNAVIKSSAPARRTDGSFTVPNDSMPGGIGSGAAGSNGH